MTGVAGFIASKAAEFLPADGHTVVGVDNLNDAYDVRLKHWRLSRLEGRPGFTFHHLDICDRPALRRLFEKTTDDRPQTTGQSSSSVVRGPAFETINLGSDQPVVLMRAVRLVEELVGKKAQIEYRPRHPADVLATWADIGKAERLLGWRPRTPFRDGVARLVEWYRENEAWAREIETG